MKILNFPDDTTIFLLRDINCHTRIQSNLKSQKASGLKTNFSKIQALQLINQDKWYGHNCTLKYLECILLIPFLITTTGT